jgi:hypothetical protein
MTIYLLEIAGYGLLLFFAALVLEQRESSRPEQEHLQLSVTPQKRNSETELHAGSASSQEAKSSATR